MIQIIDLLLCSAIVTLILLVAFVYKTESRIRKLEKLLEVKRGKTT